MEDVSDPPFRYVCKQQGADLMYTEFISSEGLIRNAAKSTHKLDVFEYERPIGIQLFGSDINSMHEAALIAEQAKPDLIDINYGCPVKQVACKGAGAALLQDIPKMVSMTKKIVDSVNLPVTVKTRLGWDDKTKNILEVAERLQDIGIKALTVHARTRSQMYKGSADWTLLGELKNNPRIIIPVFGNGDVDTPQKVVEMKNRYGVDGIMIGRASIGYPWIFNQVKQYLAGNTSYSVPGIDERIEVCRTHLLKSVEWKGNVLGILEMRRHYTNYFKGMDHIRDYRVKLVTSNHLDELLETLELIKEKYSVVV